MLAIPDALQVYVYSEPTDMRRSFNRLEAMVKVDNSQEEISGIDLKLFLAGIEFKR